MDSENYKKVINTIKTLKQFDKVLFLTCSNRYKDILKTQTPKSTILAQAISKKLNNVTIINVPDLIIHPCEGNVSREDGNKCGVKEALLKDKEKNPSGYHRCWASLHNSDDELWKISKELFESDCVVFFTSARWGNANMFYQKLIERLNWINNRFIPGTESNIIKDVNSGLICIGQHHYADKIVELQKKVHDYFGFKVNENLYWYWLAEDVDFEKETFEGYLESYPEFFEDFGIVRSAPKN
jgi:multimeric flavodoxin WrbA